MRLLFDILAVIGVAFQSFLLLPKSLISSQDKSKHFTVVFSKTCLALLDHFWKK